MTSIFILLHQIRGSSGEEKLLKLLNCELSPAILEMVLVLSQIEFLYNHFLVPHTCAPYSQLGLPFVPYSGNIRWIIETGERFKDIFNQSLNSLENIHLFYYKY